MPKHRAPARKPSGHFVATPKAAKDIRWLEEQVTDWLLGGSVSVFDVVDAAVSLAGLQLSAGMGDNVAVIQAAEPW